MIIQFQDFFFIIPKKLQFKAGDVFLVSERLDDGYWMAIDQVKFCFKINVKIISDVFSLVNEA